MILLLIHIISSVISLNYSYDNQSGDRKPAFLAEKIGELPSSAAKEKNAGVAGAFSGIFHNKLIVAGGTNFPDKKPWEGGIKIYQDQIYLFNIEGSVLKVVDLSVRLPELLAYGASISLPNGVLCIGGNGPTSCSSKVFLIHWSDAVNTLLFDKYPDLPVPLTYTTAALLDNFVYVAGGTSSLDGRETNNYFFRLDLSGYGKSSFKWEKLPPYPGLSRLLAVSVAQSKCLYLFSGRNTNDPAKPMVMKDGLVYDPVIQRWEKVQTVPESEFQVMAGSAFPWGTDNIVFVGGAPDSTYLMEQNLKSELARSIVEKNEKNSDRIKSELLSFYAGHRGFSSKIMVYNTNNRTLYAGGNFNAYCPVTTNAIPCGNEVIIPCGEIKPGIRTPDIYRISNK